MNHDDLDRLLRDYGEHWRSRQAETSTAPLIGATRSRDRQRWGWAAPALAAAVAVLVTAGVVVGLNAGDHRPAATAGGAGAGSSAEVPSSSGPGSPSSTSPSSRPVHAHRQDKGWYGAANQLPRGTSIPASEVAQSRRIQGSVRVGLAMKGKLLGFVYPVRSTDDGAHWRTSGPLMYRAGAQGAAQVDRTGVLPDGTAYVWGRGGNFVWVSHDATPPWYVANLPSLTRVWHRGNTLLARTVPEPHTPRVFRSTDDGHTWNAR